MPITPLLRESYLVMIRKSVGSRLFQSFIARDEKRSRDILENGRLSCAAFVSWILHHFGLIAEPHATVNGTVEDLAASGWKHISRPRPGAVLLWSGIRYPDGEMHRHIGFFLGGKTAVSNSTATRRPVRHHWTFGAKKGAPRRPVENIFFHPMLAGRKTPSTHHPQ